MHCSLSNIPGKHVCLCKIYQFLICMYHGQEKKKKKSFASSCRFSCRSVARNNPILQFMMTDCTDHSMTSCKRRQRVNRSHKPLTQLHSFYTNHFSINCKSVTSQ
ncbi:hypothetical protein XENOCAPTIV_000173 [Xenoophorus captivus]|uniref:Uncharacterized protein n=1 Tax=Xenoophorus captivus TaxID=1517983 RepID=A0ABV0QNY4_9TELE